MAQNKVGAQSFEAFKDNDSYTMIHTGLRRSAAWQDLTASQRGLYLEIKAEYRRKTVNGRIVSENHSELVFPATTWQKMYHSNYRAWDRDRKALVEHGFIEIQSYRQVRKPNLYKLVDGWKTWKKGE